MDSTTINGAGPSRARAIAEGRAAVRDGTLRQVRKKAGLSQREIGDAVGVSQVAVYRWETERRAPRGEAAWRLNELLVELDKVVRPGGVLVP